MSSLAVPPPPVTWAQTRSLIYVTFNVECEKPDITIEENNISFKGTCAPNRKLHAVEIPLYSKIDPEKSRQVNKGRLIDLVLVKADEDAPYWEFLTQDKKKHHWLKVDFNRWQDEDNSADEMDNMSDMFANRMGDFGDGDALEDEDGDDEEDESSEEEEDNKPGDPEGLDLKHDIIDKDKVDIVKDVQEAVESKEECGDGK